MIEEFLRFLINLSYFSFINEVVRPINAQNGDLLPASAFKGIEDGTCPQDGSIGRRIGRSCQLGILREEREEQASFG